MTSENNRSSNKQRNSSAVRNTVTQTQELFPLLPSPVTIRKKIVEYSAVKQQMSRHDPLYIRTVQGHL